MGKRPVTPGVCALLGALAGLLGAGLVLGVVHLTGVTQSVGWVPFVFLAIFLRFIDAFKLFDLVFIVSRGGPGDLTESIAYFTYVIGFKYFDLGLAAALSVLQLIIIIIMGIFPE